MIYIAPSAEKVSPYFLRVVLTTVFMHPQASTSKINGRNHCEAGLQEDIINVTCIASLDFANVHKVDQSC